MRLDLRVASHAGGSSTITARGGQGVGPTSGLLGLRPFAKPGPLASPVISLSA